MAELHQLDDNILLNKYIKNEDQKAFDILYDRHYKPIFFYVLKMVKVRDTAKELTQQTFYKFLTKVKDKYEHRGKLRSWLYQIAYHNCIDYFRKNKKFIDLENPNDDRDHSEILTVNKLSNDNPEEDLIKDQDISVLYQALKNISEVQQEVFVLRMKYQMPFKEIAEVQGVSINTSLGRMRYARKNLKKEIEKIDGVDVPK